MDRVLRFLEKFWIFAILVALVVAGYNFIQKGSFEHSVYFPLIVAFLSVVVFLNIRNQRKFVESRKNKNNKA